MSNVQEKVLDDVAKSAKRRRNLNASRSKSLIAIKDFFGDKLTELKDKDTEHNYRISDGKGNAILFSFTLRELKVYACEGDPTTLILYLIPCLTRARHSVVIMPCALRRVTDHASFINSRSTGRFATLKDKFWASVLKCKQRVSA